MTSSVMGRRIDRGIERRGSRTDRRPEPWMAPAMALLLGALLLAGLGSRPILAQNPPVQVQHFPHARHAQLFTDCSACHGDVETSGPTYPDTAVCGACHNGAVQPVVQWTPPPFPRTNLKFDHTTHPPVGCMTCHGAADAEFMAIDTLAVVSQCFACHGIDGEHPVSAPDSVCTMCHVPLPAATRLTMEDIAHFPKPDWHNEPGFVTAGLHGQRATTTSGVAASCATCHARDFCQQCHVDAPERPAIRALEPDPRSLALRASLPAPASHSAANFLAAHGTTAQRTPAQCATCHVQQTCLECHIGTPEVAKALHPAGPGRAGGAQVQRHAPPSHRGAWRANHADVAAASPQTCAGCHVRSDCLECHRTDAAAATPGFHPADFLTRHPAAAYARESSCNDCHSLRAFCVDCHKSAGLFAQDGALHSGYHDAKQFFLLGHGVAARQSLETCVSCHTERDCLACHSALQGRRVNPHGPGFDAEGLKKRNPEMCAACHGSVIP